MEIDLPRMQSLSPHFDSPPMDTIAGMTDLTDVSSPIEPDPQPPQQQPSSCSMEKANNCDWTTDSTLCGCKYENKSGCGCKYINKVSVSVFHFAFLEFHENDIDKKLFENTLVSRNKGWLI